MLFEWDEQKNKSNFIKHGILFEEAIEIFKNDCLTWTDNRKEYKEVREITIGQLKKRIISARKANIRERRKFNEHI